MLKPSPQEKEDDEKILKKMKSRIEFLKNPRATVASKFANFYHSLF